MFADFKDLMSWYSRLQHLLHYHFLCRDDVLRLEVAVKQVCNLSPGKVMDFVDSICQRFIVESSVNATDETATSIGEEADDDFGDGNQGTDYAYTADAACKYILKKGKNKSVSRLRQTS
jgi:hypothetical protein